MNNVVASYAPKHCHYSSSLSLNTRIAIAAGTQIVGHYHFWRLLLDRFDIPMHPSMKEYLQDRDKRRIKKTERNQSSEVKLKRTEKLRDTIKKEIQQDAEAKKQGKTYTSSAQPDLKAAQKAVRETMRKNRATNSINNDLL